MPHNTQPHTDGKPLRDTRESSNRRVEAARPFLFQTGLFHAKARAVVRGQFDPSLACRLLAVISRTISREQGYPFPVTRQTVPPVNPISKLTALCFVFLNPHADLS